MRKITKEFNVYNFEELPANIQEKVIEYFRETNLDYPWYDCVYDDFIAICEILGIETSDKKIFFSGFSSQGDGACFEGDYNYKKGGVKEIKSYAPLDKELHQIALDLSKLQSKAFYRLQASLKHSGRYYHEYCPRIDVSRTDYADITDAQENGIKELLRDLMRWLYKRLENEYEYLQSTEAIKETIAANEYEFTENGKIFHE